MITKYLDKLRTEGQTDSKTFFGIDGERTKAIVYGGLDGIITTFAVVAGVAGADLEIRIVLILGFANLFADGLSMAVGDFLSTRSEEAYNKMKISQIRSLFQEEPKERRLRLLQIFSKEGFSEEEANNLNKIFETNHEAAVRTTALFQIGNLPEHSNALSSAMATFSSFVLFGFIPLLVYTLALFANVEINSPMLISSSLTGATLFLLGSVKSVVTQQNWYKSGMEMLLIGGAAATVAYYIGVLLGKI